MLPFTGNIPVGVKALLFASNAETSDAAFNENATVLPAERPPEMSIAKVSVTVWPAGTFKLMPEKSSTPWFNELYW